MPVRRLGPTTLLAIMLQRTAAFFAFSILGLIVLVAIPFLPPATAQWIGYILPWIVMSSAALLFTTFIAGWFEYAHYKIFLTPYAIALTKGLLGWDRARIPYRAIRSVKIITPRFGDELGVRGILINLKGDEEKSPVFLPVLEKYLAEKLQKHLMAHASQ